MPLSRRYIKICNSTSNPGWLIFAPHLTSSLQAVSKLHCLYANAAVQPSVQHCLDCIKDKRLIFDVDTATYV